MKVKLKAIATFEWEDDSENWPDVLPTKEAILDEVRRYTEEDWSYILEQEPKKIEVNFNE